VELYPAVDILGGRAVRLQQGDFARATGYGDPLALARRYVAAGARWVHVVDLDAARSGRPVNRAVVLELVEAVAPAAVQIGGGVRRAEDAADLLQAGAARVVVGTLAAADPDATAALARQFPQRIAVGLDHRHGAVATEGWGADGRRSVTDLLARYEAEPVGGVVVTAIDRDGMLGGPDLDGLRQVLGQTRLPVVASGGVASVADLRALAGLAVLGRRLAGAIVGRALVDGVVDIDEAVRVCAASA
jgi:phosphoribosylformimino-5-aminoimidazole carboxamide ribotide isomerase